MRGEQRHAGDEGRGQRSDQQSQNEWDRPTQHAPYRLFPARRVMQKIGEALPAEGTAQ